MVAPPSHHALVGPLWADLETALQDSGALGRNAKEQINSLRGRLPPPALHRLHYVRLQRNRVTHAPTRPLSNPALWERACREAIRDVRVAAGRRAPGWSGTPSSGVPTFLRRTHLKRTGTDRRRTSDDLPAWAKVLAWGLGAYVVLQNESLTVIVGLGFICWLIWSIFGRR